MIKVVRQGVYYMDGELVKEAHAFMTSDKKEKAVKGTISHGMQKKLPKAPIVAVFLKGKLRRGAGPWDVVLSVLKATKRSAFLKEKILEFIGPGLAGLSVEARHAIDGGLAGSGRLASVWETDAKTREYDERFGLGASKELHPKAPAYYDGGVSVDLSRVDPTLMLQDGTILPVKEWKEDPSAPARFERGMVRGSYEDIAESAEIVRGKRLEGFGLCVCPTSREAALNLAENGYLSALLRAGADVCTKEACSEGGSRLSFRGSDGEEAFAEADARTVAATAAYGGALTAATDVEYIRRIKKFRHETD